MNKIKLFYRKLNRYLRYYDAPLIQKIIVLSLEAERKFFKVIDYPRTKIRNAIINRVYKKHGDHLNAPMYKKIIFSSLRIERKIYNRFYYLRTKIRNYFINRVYEKHGDHQFK